MNIIKFFKNADQKFGWSFLGFILGIIGIIISVYLTFIYEKSPNINYQIITNTDVINMKENINKLTIIYDNEVIDKDTDTLKIVTFDVVNTGNDNVGINDFDDTTPLGFIITEGQVVNEPTVIFASNDYLKQKINIKKIKNEFVFPKFILEKDEKFTVKMLVLTSRSIAPKILPIGKIAGVCKINVINELNTSEKGFLVQILNGSIMIHLIRLFIYFIIGMILITGILIPYIFISEKLEKVKKNKVIKKYKKSNKYIDDKYYTVIFELFLKYDVWILNSMLDLLSDDEKFKKLISNYKKNKEPVSKNNIIDFPLNYDYDELYATGNRKIETLFIPKLIESEIINLDAEEYKLDERFVEYIERFSDFATIIS